MEIKDTISLEYGTEDGFSYCGERIITVTPELSWLTIQDNIITCGSPDPELAPISV